MVIRLLGTIASVVLLAFFVGFNLDNKCNVSLIVKSFENVPVFITIMISFVCGIIFTMPFTFSILAKRAKKAKKAAKGEKEAVSGEKKTDSAKSEPEKIEKKPEENVQNTELETGSPV